MRVLLRVMLLFVVMVLLVGCLAGPNPMAKRAPEDGQPAGFWRGLWHGIVAPLTFILSLFVRSLHFYEVYNNGNWYNLGFVLGAGILFGGGAASRRRRRND